MKYENPDFPQITFMIPVRLESQGRIDNLEIILAYLRKYFSGSGIIVMEVDDAIRSTGFVQQQSRHLFLHNTDPVFHRTWVNNLMVAACDTPIGFFWDADIIIPPEQVITSLQAIQSNQYHFVLPYDGRFLQVDAYNKQLFKKELDIDLLLSGEPVYGSETVRSVGGAFMFRVADYIKAGLDNQHIEGWGHEDAERIKRLNKLGYPVLRARGALYHLWHERGRNSYFFDSYKATRSFETYFKTCSLSKEELQKEIATWSWIQEK